MGAPSAAAPPGRGEVKSVVVAAPANTARAADTPFIATGILPAPLGFVAGVLEEGGSSSPGIGGGDRGDDNGLARDAVEVITGFAWEEDITAGIEVDLMSPGGLERLASGFLGTAAELDAFGGLVEDSPPFVGFVADTPPVDLGAGNAPFADKACDELGLLPEDGEDLLSDIGVDVVEDGVASDVLGRVRSRSPTVVLPVASFFLLSSTGSPTASKTLVDAVAFPFAFLARCSIVTGEDEPDGVPSGLVSLADVGATGFEATVGFFTGTDVGVFA